jgi:hypothetical protein
VDDWAELEQLIEELRSANQERWTLMETTRQQLAGLQPHLDVISRQYEALEIERHLREMNERLLGGLGNVEVVQSGMGIEFIAALIWPASLGPAEADNSPEEGTICRIEVWLGPGLQDGRARIRIAGAKRLEAVLPTTSERFRIALLSVFRNPQMVRQPVSGATEEEQGSPSSASGRAGADDAGPSSASEQAGAEEDLPPAEVEEAKPAKRPRRQPRGLAED